MSHFKIGSFEFINLSRAMSRPTQRLTREVRSGVAGVTMWRTGKRAEPLQVMSVVDCTDVPAALDLLKQYEALVGGDPVLVIWAGDAPLEDLLVVVSDVQPVDGGLHKMLLGIGGTKRGASNALLRAVWTLHPIDPGQ